MFSVSTFHWNLSVTKMSLRERETTAKCAIKPCVTHHEWRKLNARCKLKQSSVEAKYLRSDNCVQSTYWKK